MRNTLSVTVKYTTVPTRGTKGKGKKVKKIVPAKRQAREQAREKIGPLMEKNSYGISVRILHA